MIMIMIFFAKVKWQQFEDDLKVVQHLSVHFFLSQSNDETQDMCVQNKIQDISYINNQMMSVVEIHWGLNCDNQIILRTRKKYNNDDANQIKTLQLHIVWNERYVMYIM